MDVRLLTSEVVRPAFFRLCLTERELSSSGEAGVPERQGSYLSA